MARFGEVLEPLIIFSPQSECQQLAHPAWQLLPTSILSLLDYFTLKLVSPSFLTQMLLINIYTICSSQNQAKLRYKKMDSKVQLFLYG